MSKKEFKTESKKLLDLMIHSIYTNKEIFLRELISNASDALDKYHFNTLTDTTLDTSEELGITLVPNKEERTFTIIDNGIGLTKEEAEENLGTIAKSGSKEFIEKMKENKENTDDVDIIGQFGVGFYSSFIVGNKVEVRSKSPYSDKGVLWISEGEDTYEVSDIDKDTRGTEIKIFLRDDVDENEFYTEFTEERTIKNLVTKYSDYVKYPIKMNVTTSKLKEGSEDEYEDVTELEVLNSMTPLWKKRKSEITEEDYNEFYKGEFHRWDDPLKTIHLNIEGTLSYNALIYIPSKAPMDFYTANYEKGLELYAKGVFIMEKNKDLIPDYFMFCEGLVDSSDLSLNISREILQQDRQLKLIASNIEKKIKSELEKMQKKDRENYDKLFEEFGKNIKYGIYQDFGAKKDFLKDLVMFKSNREKKYVTLAEYIANMSPDQKHIYYATGSSIAQIDALPQVERLNDKGYEYLYFLDDIDEFAINLLGKYEDKDFKSINQGDLDLDTEEEKKEIEEKNESSKDLLTSIKDNLEGKVKDVKLSSRLKSHPVCLISEDGVSLQMEQLLANTGQQNALKATKVLEINPDHAIFEALNTAHSNKSDSFADYSTLLYEQAMLIEGYQLEDPVAFSDRMTKLMVENMKK